jgi:hypothetical protein
MPYYREQDNPFLKRAQKLFEASSGMNAYNRMVQTGTAKIARSSSDMLEQLRGMIGRNPALLRDIVSEISDKTGSQYADLAGAAQQLESNLNLAEANRMTNVGLSAEQNQLTRDQLDQQKKLMWADIVTGLIGGGLSAGGSIIGAKMGANSLKDLYKELFIDELKNKQHGEMQ